MYTSGGTVRHVTQVVQDGKYVIRIRGVGFYPYVPSILVCELRADFGRPLVKDTPSYSIFCMRFPMNRGEFIVPVTSS